jgi:hypothetical protein
MAHSVAPRGPFNRDFVATRGLTRRHGFQRDWVRQLHE